MVAGAASRSASDLFWSDAPPVLKVLDQRGNPREGASRRISSVHHVRRVEGVVERLIGQNVQDRVEGFQPFD